MAGSPDCNTPQTPSASTDVSRRNVLRGATLAAGGILAAGVTVQPAEAKMTAAAAGYVAESKTADTCSNCTLFVAPASCKIVDGTISPKGYCRFFVKKS
jgi:hypothetical protein